MRHISVNRSVTRNKHILMIVLDVLQRLEAIGVVLGWCNAVWVAEIWLTAF